MGVMTMVMMAALAWIACAVLAYAAHTLGTLLIWSIPVPVIMVSWLISMRLLYHDGAYAFSFRRQRRPSAKEKGKAVRSERHTGDVERLDAAA
jgi:hypothetical protein